MGMNGIEEGTVGDKDLAGGSEHGEAPEGTLHVKDLIARR